MKSFHVAVDAIKRYVQARIGGGHASGNVQQMGHREAEHDSRRPVNGYSAPQLHAHMVFFDVTVTEDGKPHAVQPQELYRSQQYGTAGVCCAAGLDSCHADPGGRLRSDRATRPRAS